MPQKDPPTRSLTRAVLCFLIAAAFFGWVVEGILRGRFAFDGRYGHVEHRGAGGVLFGMFIFSVGSAVTCFGLANLKPDRSSVLTMRAGIFGVVGFACVLLTLLIEGIWN